MRALLDVNVLIALHDANHAHHAVATQWLMAQSGYSNPQPLPILMRMLQKSTQSGAHEFWGDGPSLLDATRFQHAHIHSPRQLTDLYLLALAVGHQGRLVTFDQRIPLSAVHGASSQHLVVL